MPQILRLALPVPLPTLFDYLAPPGGGCLPGCRVLAPFGRTRQIGVVIDSPDSSELPPGKLKQVLACLDPEPLLDADHLAYLRWAARYYHHPEGEVVNSALPLRLRKQQQALALSEPCWRVCDSPTERLGRAPRQREIHAFVAAAGEAGVSAQRLRSAFPGQSASIRRLREIGLIEEFVGEPPADVHQVRPPRHALNPQQQQAVQSVAAGLEGFAAFLLQGVTGSGKTEVYLELVAQVLARGRTAMVLVPEISLTPQLQQRFVERLGGPVPVLHSGMSDSERERVWQRLRLGLSRVVLGTRSLVLYPADSLGLLVVDEEHDGSFKQQDGWRYSARDLAVVRARRSACPVLLGSATPSLESLHNAQRGRYQLLRLDRRAGSARPPAIDLLDIRDQPLRSGLSSPLVEALRRTLDAGEQAMVFINRRGYAPVLACRACGWVSECARCDAHQTLHRASGLLWCHHCGAQRRAPSVCPQCGEQQLYPLGQGTERIEEMLSGLFPDVPLIRVDRDATARKGSLEKLLAQVHGSDSALLVGTQMLAKGHHFPRVTLVEVVDADGGLFSADFRATERLAQLLLQVAGRAGRGERLGRVLIQTRFPDHPLLRTLVTEGYDAFAAAALCERADAEYPPYTHQALLRAEASGAEPPRLFLQQVADWIGSGSGSGTGSWPGIELWGPVPAPMARRVGRHRAHLLIQAAAREHLHPVLDALQPWLATVPGARKVRWSLDVDPLDNY